MRKLKGGEGEHTLYQILEKYILDVLKIAGIKVLKDPHKFTSMLFDVSNGTIPNWNYLAPICSDKRFLDCFTSASGISEGEMDSCKQNAEQLLLTSKPLDPSWVVSICEAFGSALKKYYGIEEHFYTNHPKPDKEPEEEEKPNETEPRFEVLSMIPEKGKGPFSNTSLVIWAAIYSVALCWMLALISMGEKSFSVLEILLSVAILGSLFYLMKKTDMLKVMFFIAVEFLVLDYQLGWAFVTLSDVFQGYILFMVLSIVTWLIGSGMILLCIGRTIANKRIVPIHEEEKKHINILAFGMVVLLHVASIALLFAGGKALDSVVPSWFCLAVLIIADILFYTDSGDKLLYEGFLLAFVVGIMLAIVLSGLISEILGSDSARDTIGPVLNHLMVPNLAVAGAVSMRIFFKNTFHSHRGK